uniref:Uncharacterized protein n=1 Tax=Anopheles atroparvus TaxID=41427 RepID=A0A182JJ06_ANOAO
MLLVLAQKPIATKAWSAGQVFHICDEGKKISFLCPNGTIFRQLDLICDWWFKVDCAATPNHYAESTEMLTQAKRARLQSKHPVPQPINPNDERLTTSIQDKRLLLASIPVSQRQQQHQPPHAYPLEPIGNVLEFNRRMDSINSAEVTSGDSERGVSGRRGRDRKGARKISFDTADEIQDTAQSASFASVAQKMFNSYYAHDKPPKDAQAGKLRSENQADDASPLHGRSTLPDSKDASAKGYSNNHAVNYIPYTTARKLNLSGKVTQFYTPTVPTFTTSTKTTVVEATTATTKATIGGGDGDRESHSRPGQPGPIRRDGTIDESVMDHAMEIMQTIKSLKIDDASNNENSADGSSDALGVRFASPRADYQISPSSSSSLTSPASLLSPSLPVTDSIEFVVQSSGSEPNADRFRRMRLGERKADVPTGHRSLLTCTTLNEYDRLFRTKDAEDENRLDNGNQHNLTDSDQYYMDSTLDHDLEGQSSRYPVFGMSNSTQIRELAQIFTHALSAYLQDPVTFRRILTEIRPKAPTTDSSAYLPSKSNELDGQDRSRLGKYTTDQTMTFRSTAELSYYAPLKAAENSNGEVLDFSDVTTTTTAQSPTETTATETTAAITSTIPTTTTNEPVNLVKMRANGGVKQAKSLSIQFITGSRNELADEVNGELGSPALANNNHGYTDQGSFEARSNSPQTVATIAPLYNQHSNPSTVTVGTSATTEQIPSPHSELKPPIIPADQYSAVRTPKTTQPLDDDEQLQRAQSESILGSNNPRPIYERSQYSIIQLNNLKSNNNYAGDTSATSSTLTTTNVNELKSAESDKQTSNTGPPSRTTMSYTVFFDPLTINDELMELDKPKPTVSHAAAIHQPRLYGWNGTLLNAPDSASANGQQSARLVMRQPADAADMQQKANEMFGDLNDAEADKLMSVMKMADKDKSMRRLILLLIRTCDDDPSTANEESRKALLDALINIDGVTGPHGTNDLRSGASFGQVRDQGNRRGKQIGADGARILYDGPVVQSTHNYTATTENYATVAESNEDGGSEAASKEDAADSEELSRESVSHTTSATTRVYSSSETHQGYQSSNGNVIRGRWANEYDEAQTQVQTTTPLSTTLFQTTTNTGSTLYTSTEPTTIPTTTILTTSGSDYASSTVGTSTTSTTNRADGLESFESDPSLELQPPIVVSQRLPKDLSSSLDYPGSGGGGSKKHSSPHYSDTRALELLKSLYSLAARWG